MEDELYALENSEGESVAEQVTTAPEAFGLSHHPDLPDLIVLFRTDLGPLETCQSRRVGVVHRALWKPELPRTGAHTVESRLWVIGPAISPGRQLHEQSVLNLAATVLHLLDLPGPQSLDGEIIPAVRGRGRVTLTGQRL